jgi:hypothetical protein
MVSDFPNFSISKASSAIIFSPTLVLSLLLDDLNLEPCKLNTWNKLGTHNCQKRADFRPWFLSLARHTKFWLITSHEAYFYQTQPQTKQNQRTWTESNLNEGIEITLYVEKILCFFAISVRKIFWLYYNEESAKNHNKLHMLQSFFCYKHLWTLSYIKHCFFLDGSNLHGASIEKNLSMDNFLT